MFDIASTELLLVAVVALVVIGPKDLPRVMRVVGQWVGRARGMARHFRSGIDEMIRQSELQEMEARWAAENERIMREHPPVAAGATAPDILVEQEIDHGVGAGPEPVADADPADQPMLPLASPPAADRPA